jgi:twinkle protein
MFAQRAEITFFLVAHPAKPMGAGADFVPTGYSISGSAHFFNRADFGLTVHRKDGFSNVHVWKARFGHQGRNGVAKLIYDNKTGGYVEQLTPVIAPPDDWNLDLPGEEDPLPF